MRTIKWISAVLAIVLLAVILAITVGCDRLTAVQDTSQYRSAAGWPSGIYRTWGGKTQVAPSGTEIEMKSGSTLDMQTGMTWTYNDVTVSGPVRFGSQSNVTDGVTITHGLGTTPTMIVLTPRYTSDLTQTVFVSTTNATTFDIQVEAGGVTTLTEVYWMVGK